MMKLCFLILAVLLDVVPYGKAYLKPLQERDSVLVADQFEYGFRLDGITPGTLIEMQDPEVFSHGDTLVLVRPWDFDTLKTDRKSGNVDLVGKVVVAPFEEGKMTLPPVAVRRTLPGGQPDTLLFEPAVLDVKTMPVDTATFVIHDIKGQMRYPLTFKETLPYCGGLIVLAGLVWLTVVLIRRRKTAAAASAPAEPSYIVALRELEKFRAEKYHAPAMQKAYYSGITDALKTYIEDRFGVDAPEMTSAELFAALKGNKGITPEVFEAAKDLFECADFVKFAKHSVSAEESMKALGVAVNFVTSTHQSELEEEQQSNVL